MAVDLCLIWMAGVMPFGKEQARNAPDYVHDIDEFLTMANLEMTKNAELTYPAWLISYLRNEKDYEKLQVLKRQRKEA
ncbi:MAG: hypothetical protein H3Z53_07425 [archaeon]|nr:hypothetical protein [archaeon]